jgi:hypothetical protein
MVVSNQFVSKIKSVSKTGRLGVELPCIRPASDKSQMVSDLISLRNRTETIRRWPQLTKL